MPAQSASSFEPRGPVCVVAVDMGYGHLRPAFAVAELLGVPVQSMDAPPFGDEEDQRFWERVRRGYEPFTRATQLPWVGRPLGAMLEALTHIGPPPDLRAPPVKPGSGVRWLSRAGQRGLGRRATERLREQGSALFTTFYAPAILADLHGLPRSYCLVTDSDIHRIWVPEQPEKSRVVYFAPTERAARRLRSYGVPEEQVIETGFPLPHELLGGEELPVLRRDLAARLTRLDPTGSFRARRGEEVARQVGPLPAAPSVPPRLAFAVGGAGAQVGLAQELTRALSPMVRAGKLRLLLVAGRRAKVAQALTAGLAAADLGGHPGAEVLFEPDVFDYFRRFHAALRDTDVLWTKPSEMVFFAAAGIPLILAPPIGDHEVHNRRWVLERGGAVAQVRPSRAAGWLSELLEDGVLAAAAWAGFCNLPQQGLYRIAAKVAGSSASYPGSQAASGAAR